MAFGEEDTLLPSSGGGNSNDHHHGGMSGSKREKVKAAIRDLAGGRRRECVVGISAIVAILVVLGLVCSLFAGGTSDSTASPHGTDLPPPSEIERKDAASNRLSNKAGGRGPRKEIPEENSSRAGVIDRIMHKSTASPSSSPASTSEQERAAKSYERKVGPGDFVQSAHPEEAAIVQGKSINPRFIREDVEASTTPGMDSFAVRDILGVLGAIALFAGFIPQQAQIFRTRDVSSFSLLSLGLFFGGSLCFGLFYWAAQAWGIAVLCFWTSANAFVLLAMKYRYENSDGSSGGSLLPLMSESMWRSHEVL